MEIYWVSKGIDDLLHKTGYHHIFIFESRVVKSAVASLFLLIICFGMSWAGPPFRTDDPEPVDYKHGEFYVATDLPPKILTILRVGLMAA